MQSFLSSQAPGPGPRLLVGLLVAAALIGGACGGDEEPSTSPSGTGGDAATGGGGMGGASSTGGAGGTATGSGGVGGAGGSVGGAGGMGDPCVDRPPLPLTSEFDVLYSNANPTPQTFVGTTAWIDAFDMEFPDDSGTAKRIRTDTDHYAVIAFDTFDVQATSGTIHTDNPQITTQTGTKLVAISPCPGDFAPPLDDPECRRSLGPVGNLTWSFEDEPFSCQLQRDRQYYLNIVFTEDEELPISWACSIVPEADSCMMLFNSTAG